MTPVPSAPPARPRRRLRLSADPDVRSVQVGVIATILIHLLLLFLVPRAFRSEPASPRPPATDQFTVELQPDAAVPPKPKNQPHFVETNPNAPDNPPDKTDNVGAQNQQVAQEKPSPESKSDRPAIEGEKNVHSTQIVDGHLSEPNTPAPPAPAAPVTPPTPPADAPKRGQDTLSGFEKALDATKDSVGSNIAKVSPHPESIPEKVDGVKDTPVVEGATSMHLTIDPRKPMPRPQLARNVRPAVFEQNRIGTANIGPVAYDAKWSNYGQYMQRMIEAIQQRWDILIDASKFYPQRGSEVTVKFVIGADGKIATIVKVDGSAGDLANNWCVTAISPNESFSYGPWTDDMIAVLGDKQELTFTFLYR